jgi:DNA repair exonuclease SbcCD ATPase subunit
MAAKKQADKRDEKIAELTAKIAVLNEITVTRVQQIEDQRKTIVVLQENLNHAGEDLHELAQDYLELAESVGAAFTTAKRIIERHGIQRTTVVTQGIASRV